MGLNEKFFKSADEDEPFFNTVLYTGSGDTTNGQSITGVGFEPDLVWIKSRNDSYNNVIYDSIKGVNSAISSNLTDAAWANRNRFESFDLDGFTIEADNSGDLWKIDRENTNFVAWCWKAGGAAVSNTDGSTNSQVSANVANGFSIVKTASTSGSITFGHGLDSAPEMIINKGYVSGGWNWLVYHKDVGTGKYLQLNSAATTLSYSPSFSSVTSTTITHEGSLSSQSYVNYCFHSVAGVSKVGSYTGNGNTNGPVVPLGFEPAWVMIKGANEASDWIIIDNKRDTTNPNSARLDANGNGAEYNGEDIMDLDSTSFQLKTSSASKNASGKTFIYYAIA